MGPFFDTGVALKLVVSEPLSGRVLDLVKKRRVPVPVSRLIELEMETALNAMVFRSHITTPQLATAKTPFSEMTNEGNSRQSASRSTRSQPKASAFPPLSFSRPDVAPST